MRVSVHKDDCGYRTDACDFNVFLDGELLKSCFTADEELGEAHCYRLDATGNLMRNESGDAIQTEVRRGAVRLEKRAA
jgi:hypothetical protein